MEKDIHVYGNQKKVGIAILTSDKIALRFIRNKGRVLYNNKGVNKHEDKTFVNICVPKIGAPKYMANINRPNVRNGRQYSNSSGP